MNSFSLSMTFSSIFFVVILCYKTLALLSSRTSICNQDEMDLRLEKIFVPLQRHLDNLRDSESCVSRFCLRAHLAGVRASTMAFFPLLTSPPVFLPLLPSGARALSSRARVRLNRLLLHPFLARHTRPLGRIPFPFLPSPLPSCLHFSSSVYCPRNSSYSFPPPPIPSCASCVTSLSSSSPSSSRTMFCAISFLN